MRPWLAACVRLNTGARKLTYAYDQIASEQKSYDFCYGAANSVVEQKLPAAEHGPEEVFD